MAVRSLLPVCDGPHGVSCMDLMEPNGENGQVGLFLRVYYPTDKFTPDPDSDTDSTPWIPHEGYVEGMSDCGTIVPLVGGLVKRFFRSSLTNAKAGRRVAAKWGAPLKEGARYPVIVFSHGLSAARFHHSTLSCSLAAEGFVVFILEHGDGSACWTYRGNEQNAIPFHVQFMKDLEANRKNLLGCVKARCPELERCIDLIQKLEKGQAPRHLDVGAEFDWRQFQGRMDVARLSLMSHSLGGPSVLSVLANGKRQIHCAVILDGTMMVLPRAIYPQILASKVPILFINADAKYKMEVERRLKLVEGEPLNRMVTIKNSSHISYCDLSHLFPKCLAWGSIDAKQCDQITVDLAAAFISGCRNGELDALKRDGALLHPEFVFEPTTESVQRKLVKDFELAEDPEVDN